VPTTRLKPHETAGRVNLSNSIWHVIGTGTIGTGMVLAFELLIKLELLLLRLFVLGVSWGRP
jgi:hypothetical protein